MNRHGLYESRFTFMGRDPDDATCPAYADLEPYLALLYALLSFASYPFVLPYRHTATLKLPLLRSNLRASQKPSDLQS
jgi:hypothetical protein